MLVIVARMTDKTTSPSSSARGAVLHRGKACIRCRRRKTKCDSARPACTPCIEANRVDDCEYTDNQGRTRTQMLEENITRLEARLQELEGSADSSQSLLLHDPYVSSASSRTTHGQYHEPPADQIIQAPGPPPPQDTWWEQEQLPAQISDALISTFLPRSGVLRFAIDPVRFRDQLCLPLSHPERPHEALLNAVYLWASRMSNSLELRQREGVFINRTVLALQISGGAQSQNTDQGRVQAIQAEVLVAQYFFCLGHTLEGRYHANAAVSLAIGCGLHRYGDLADTHGAASGGSVLSTWLSLAPARDEIEKAERIRVFWVVFELDSCWSVALEVPHSLSDERTRGTQIDTPWSGEQWRLILYTSQYDCTGRTVQKFLSGHSILEYDSHSVTRAKASALYERAASLAARFSLESSLGIEVQTLAQITTQFAQSLSPLDQLNEVGDDVRLILAVTHGIAHASMIHLHRAQPSETTPDALSASLPHADEILAILEFVCSVSSVNVEEQHARRVVLDPILAVVGSTAGRVFIEELDRSKHRTQEAAFLQEVLRLSIDRLINVLRGGFADMYPIFSQHADRIEEKLLTDLL